MLYTLLTKEKEVPVNGRIIEWYLSKGYVIPTYWSKKHNKFLVKRGTTIVVDSNDLPNGSHEKVEVSCDYCGKIRSIAYKDYLSQHDDEMGDCCKSCEFVKCKKTMLDKYGVDNSFEIPDIIDKTIATNREKYGCDWQMQSARVKEKSVSTMISKYGVKSPLQKEEFLNKMIETKCKNHSNPTSQPQIKLSYMLNKLFGNCALEVPCDRCSLDCVVDIDGVLIDVEYDGLYWHSDKQRDRRRDNFVKSKGYKILRVLGNKKDEMPTEKCLLESIETLLNGRNYIEIVM